MADHNHVSSPNLGGVDRFAGDESFSGGRRGQGEAIVSLNDVHFESCDAGVDRAGWRQEVGGDGLAKGRRQAGEEDQTGDDHVKGD